MPLVKYEFDTRIGPVVEIEFAHPGAAAQAVRGSKPEMHRYNALIDTGASMTGISKKLADAVGLRARGKLRMVSPHGTKDSNKYYADVFIPVVNLWNMDLEIIEVHGGFLAFDALLGRDILRKGLLTVDGPKGGFTFSVQRGTPVGRA